MTTNQINAYSTSPTTTSTASINPNSTISSEAFLKLLAAQMSNQDVMNPTDNTEYMSQLAQFSSLQAMTTLSETATSQLDAFNTLSQISYAQYGASLVGKNVVVGYLDDSGKYIEDTGVVTSTNFASGVYTVTVNDKKYNLSSVMEVNSVEKTDVSAATETNTDTISPTQAATETSAYTIGVPQNTAEMSAM